MLKADDVRLQHMRDAVNEVLEFINGRKREDLDSDRMLLHALVRLLEIIGEAANGMSEEFRQQYPSLPWKQMIGMRNRLIHGYFEVDLDIVWITVSRDIVGLKGQIDEIV